MTRFLPCLLLLLLTDGLPAADWVQFRGAGAVGVSTETAVPLQWSDTKNLAWKLALPGKGFSSPI
ncbi:MAG: serine/threonine protein kinase, partial [Planctomycetota bacterium]|nr:serine/threonine protein kinase [Planctomycetota bacterium]